MYPCQDILELICSYLPPIEFYKVNTLLNTNTNIYWKYYYRQNNSYPDSHCIMDIYI